MVIGAIPAIVRIGIVVYKVVTAQNKVISKAWQGFNKDIVSGIQWGAGLGALIGSTVDYYARDETDGNIIGVPETPFQQGNDNRFGQARKQVFNSSSKRRYCKKRSYRRG